LQTVGDGRDAATRVEQRPGDSDEIAGKSQHHQGDGDERQHKQHYALRSSSTPATVSSFRPTLPATVRISVATPMVGSSAVMLRVLRSIPAAACKASAA